jgi:hypothetical protein
MKDFKFKMTFIEVGKFIEDGFKDGNYYHEGSTVPYFKLTHSQFCKLMSINLLGIKDWIEGIKNNDADRHGFLEITNLPNSFSFLDNHGKYTMKLPSGEVTSDKEKIIKQLNSLASNIGLMIMIDSN